MNSWTFLLSGIIILNIPIYYLLKRRTFTLYMSVLLGGSVIQHIGTVMMWNYDRVLATGFYEGMMIIMEIALIAYILTKYIGIQILQDKRFYTFLLSTFIGLSVRIVLRKSALFEIESIFLVFTVLTVILAVVYFYTQWEEKGCLVYGLDNIILLSLGFYGVLYLGTYFFSSTNYTLQGLLLVVLYTSWLIIGLSFLLRQKLHSHRRHHV